MGEVVARWPRAVRQSLGFMVAVVLGIVDEPLRRPIARLRNERRRALSKNVATDRGRPLATGRRGGGTGESDSWNY